MDHVPTPKLLPSMIDLDDETPRDVDNDEFYELFECAPLTTGRTIMRRRRFEPLRPEEIPDGQATGRLWELLYALAAHRCFFHGTDGLPRRSAPHPTDREVALRPIYQASPPPPAKCN